MRKIIIMQFVVLFTGTIFAWFNFYLDFSEWLAGRACATGCAVGLINPFLTPCFFGALFFFIAFILSLILIRKSGSK